MGSTLPCGQVGAEPTIMIVLSLMASDIAGTSARRSSPCGTRTTLRSMYAAALLNEGWAVYGTTISGVARPGRWSRAQSRTVLTA